MARTGRRLSSEMVELWYTQKDTTGHLDIQAKSPKRPHLGSKDLILEKGPHQNIKVKTKIYLS